MCPGARLMKEASPLVWEYRVTGAGAGTGWGCVTSIRTNFALASGVVVPRTTFCTSRVSIGGDTLAVLEEIGEKPLST